MKTRTLVIAGIWTVGFGWSAVAAALGMASTPQASEAPSALAVNVAIIAGLLLFAVSGVALIRRRAWGWWVVTIAIALLAAALLLGVILGGPAAFAGTSKCGTPAAMAVVFGIGAVLLTVPLILLLTDPPSRWVKEAKG